jgi:hypothetical protein
MKALSASTLAALAALLFILNGKVGAEPYLAVQTGHQCSACHTDPTGGGKRTPFGNLYAQTQLATRHLSGSSGPKYWTGIVNEMIAVGGDFRSNLAATLVSHQDDQIDFAVDEALVYADISLISNLLSVYLDERIAPGGSSNREAYARLNLSSQGIYFKAGQFFLPYGLRLEDDTAFIRQVPGINYNTPDTGVEVGWERGPWSAQLAVNNGSAGGAETDKGKQFSLLGTYVQPKWRVGGSFNFNDSEVGDRRMQNLYAGLRTGPIAWLGEVDYIIDHSSPTGRRKSWASLVEADWLFRRGHNLKLSYEYFDPDDDLSEDAQLRYSLIWEIFPIQFVQARLGYRRYDGIPQNDLQNRDELFIQLHIYL